MGLVVTVELLTGSFEAAQADDRDRAEWPPHPARLVCALRAVARGEGDRAALCWLATQPPPLIVAADQAWSSRREAYVVTNALITKGKSQTHPGRTNQLQVRTRALPADSTVTMVWPGPVDPNHVRALDGMARRIPYLGRSTGIALVAAAAREDDEPVDAAVGVRDGHRVVFEACDLLDGEVSVRVPYPGYVEDLEAQFDAGRPAWEVTRHRAYRRRPIATLDACGPPAGAASDDLVAGTDVVPSVYTDVLVFQFSGLRPQARLAVRLTEALRSAVLRGCGRQAPAVLHGHDAPGRPHVAFLALPDVGHERADGHLLGLAVAVPELPAEQRSAVLRAVLGLRCAQPGPGRPASAPRVVELAVPRLGAVQLIYQPGLVRPWGASPQRWRRGSRRWVSATPVVLDRHPKRPGLVEHEVRRCLRVVGLPDPVDVQVSMEPLLAGAARLRPMDLPQHSQRRLYRHVAVTFDRQVTGPVLVGAGRYLGVGLLAPVVEEPVSAHTLRVGGAGV
jgi:CRISPR-associated protein Csb2